MALSPEEKEEVKLSTIRYIRKLEEDNIPVENIIIKFAEELYKYQRDDQLEIYVIAVQSGIPEIKKIREKRDTLDSIRQMINNESKPNWSLYVS